MIRHINWLGWVALFLNVTKWLGNLWLQRLNQKHVRDHAGAVPEAFKGVVDEATYAKSVKYTLAKGRLSEVELTWHTVVVLVVLLSGVLPWAFHLFTQQMGGSAWAMAAFLLAAGGGVSLPGLPLDW